MKIKQMWLFFFLIPFFCCGPVADSPQATKKTLILGAYTVPKEVYQKAIIPEFKRHWHQKTGETIEILQSYIASGAQSRAILAGFEADIAALSLEQDVQRLVEAGIVDSQWKSRSHGGFVTHSLVVIGYRSGNPKNIRNWQDLTRKDVEVVYPSPKTSGGAMWFVNAIYGGALKEREGLGKGNGPVHARDLLKKIQARVKVMDKSGRESVTTFESGIGDALLTYENEALLRQKQGKEFPFLIPEATILIENPVAMVDQNVEKHGVRLLAQAFIDFLFTEEAQRAFARYGFRTVNPRVAEEYRQHYPEPRLLFTIEYLGGWDKVHQEIFGSAGIWTQIITELGTER